jgi:hypothetical protein
MLPRRTRPLRCLAFCALLAAAGCRKATHNPPEPPEPIDAQHTVSAGALYNNMLLISGKCANAPFLEVAQQVIAGENPAPGVVFVLRSDEKSPNDRQAYNLENARSLVALLHQQVSSSLESGPQQACVEQVADHLGRLVTNADRTAGGNR